MLIDVEIPEYSYWKRQINCQSACPVYTDARGYVRAIAEGKFEQAYLIARAPNPLAAICGSICAAPCERACRRGAIDQSISIRALKRFAAEEARELLGNPLEVIRRIKDTLPERKAVGLDDLGVLLENLESGRIKKAAGQSVGIIGSGPAGLSAAHDLAVMGFKPVVYETENIAGGMLALGVPPYRLSRAIIAAEVAAIQALGVEIRTNCTIGVELSFEELRKRHQAVIIAVGCKKARSLSLPGIEGAGVISGVDFLRTAALSKPLQVGKKVVVIGGGNVAYDIARSALRRQQMDVVVTARRERKDASITLCCLERRDEMLADEIEILEGEEEGVVRLNGYGPQEVIRENGVVKGVSFCKVRSLFDEQGRFNPAYDKSDVLTLEADTVFLSVGQRADLSFIDEARDDIRLDNRGLIAHDSNTLETSASGVFVAGDLARGPGIMIDAIASGKHAARSVYQKILGAPLELKAAESHLPILSYSREMGYEKLRRQVLETVEVEERVLDLKVLVEKGFSPGTARVESSRCLDCAVNTIFDGARCIMCGGCVDVCPSLCLKLVSVTELRSAQPFFDELLSRAKEQKATEELSAIIKDEERCIRCGLCALRCPVGAVTMERFSWRESWEQQ